MTPSTSTSIPYRPLCHLSVVFPPFQPDSVVKQWDALLEKALKQLSSLFEGSPRAPSRFLRPFSRRILRATVWRIFPTAAELTVSCGAVEHATIARPKQPRLAGASRADADGIPRNRHFACGHRRRRSKSLVIDERGPTEHARRHLEQQHSCRGHSDPSNGEATSDADASQ